jgi:hypothetical protein
VTKIKSERYHWWPECVSDYWKDDEGQAHWIWPDGTIKCMPPKNLGVIGNGHHIKLGNSVRARDVVCALGWMKVWGQVSRSKHKLLPAGGRCKIRLFVKIDLMTPGVFFSG